jgi:predicted RNA binding protein YcfA (HicA-like mRNA interferase family)
VPTKVRDAIRLIEEDGWFLIATRGDHRQFKHLVKRGRVTIAGNRQTICLQAPSIASLKQAGLKEPR